MKIFKSINSLLFIALMAFSINMVTGVNFYAIGGTLLFFGALASLPGFPAVKGMALMAVTMEIWETDIVENLFKNNEFAKRAFSADQYVLSGKVVHIPRAGTPASITKNLNVFPAVAVKRTDDDITYAIDTFYTTPHHVENIEKYELSYDKRQSVLGEDQQALIDTAMDGLVYNWGPLVANVVFTSGDNVVATLDGATGNRKSFTKESLQAIKLKMDKAKIPGNGRVALLTADHYNQFFNSLSEAEKTNFNNVANLATGVVGKYLNIDIMMRSSVLRYRGDDAAVVKVDEYDAGFAASDQTSDRAASLVYHEKSVERAFGNVEMFDRVKDPTYYGDVYSFTLRMGGRIRRTAGVYAIVEGLAA